MAQRGTLRLCLSVHRRWTHTAAIDWPSVLARCGPAAAAAIGEVRSRHAELERLLSEARRTLPALDIASYRKRLIAGPPADSPEDIAAAEELLAQAEKDLSAAMAAPPTDVSETVAELDRKAEAGAKAARSFAQRVESQVAELQQRLSALRTQPPPEDLTAADVFREYPVLGKHYHDAIEADDWSDSAPPFPKTAPALEGVATPADYGETITGDRLAQ